MRFEGRRSSSAFLQLCFELTVPVPEEKTSCFNNEVPGEVV